MGGGANGHEQGRPAPAPTGAVEDGDEGSGKSLSEGSGNQTGKVVANPEVGSSGKSAGEVVANPEVGSSGKWDLPLDEELDEAEVEEAEEIDGIGRGWRLERNSNGYYRWRWQLKDENGRPMTYVNGSGNVGYKRGSKYVGKKEKAER